MAVIVQHEKTKKKFVLLGVGYGAYKSSRPGFFGGNLFPDEEEGNIQVVCICNKDGDIKWVSSNMLKVIEVDGMKLDELSILCDYKPDNKETDQILINCPGCGEVVSPEAKICPECELILIDDEYDENSNTEESRDINNLGGI